MLELVFRPDPGRPQAVYQQLAAYLRGLVEAGQLVPGERLPPSRELAGLLGLARNTVCHAYQLLVDDGVLTARVGRGTFVAAGRLRALEGGRRAAPTPAGPGSLPWDGLLSQRVGRLQLAPGSAGLQRGPVRFDFAGGMVDAGSLPAADLRRAWSRGLAESLELLARPLDPMGLPALREEIALSLVARGIECEADDVLVTTGVHQAFDLVGRALLDPGDTAVVEQPGYFGAALCFRAHGARLVGIDVDEEGLDVDELARVLRVRRAKLVYVTPSAQSPTGVVLSERRRQGLLELAARHQVPIFEDDYDSELRFRGPPLPALKTLDRSGLVLYAGTFSKALFPGLRVGYVVAPRPLLARLALFRLASDFATDGAAQAAVLELMMSGALERHVRRMRRLYTRRRRVLLEALAEHMPEGTRWTEPEGGHAVWVTLAPDLDPERLQASALAAGLRYARGDFFSIDGRFASCIPLSFTSQSESRIEQGVALLAQLVQQASRRGARA